MGKYSLDAFETYELVKLRPSVADIRPGSYRVLTLSQAELEPEKRILLEPPAIGDGPVLLRLECNRDICDACGFIRRMGAYYDGGKNLDAVIMTSHAFTGAALLQLVQSYRQGFENTFLLAEPGTELMDVCQQNQMDVGLWLELSRGILPLRLEIGRAHLERTWREQPVYVAAGGTLTEAARDAVHRWHCSGADQEDGFGALLTLRRMMFPKGLTAGGVMPVRMWWQNIGTAPCYRDAHVLLALGDEQLPLHSEKMKKPGLGDTMLNTTAHIPQLPTGTYSLWCGIECGGKMMPLAMEAPEKNGSYRIGEVTLDDTPRPYLEFMWETQYADGYYPLEDPAEPE